MRKVLRIDTRIAILAPLVLVGVALFAWWMVSQVFATSPVERLTFYDDKRATSFTVVVNPLSPQLGQFIFSISGVGQYAGGSADSFRVLPNGRIEIHHRDSAVFSPTDQSEVIPITTAVVLNANIDPTDMTATVTISENKPKRQFQLIATPPKKNLGDVVASYTAAAVQSDFATLYDLVSRVVTGNLTQHQFAQILQQQISEQGRIIQIENLSSPMLESNAAGLIFFTIEQRVVSEKGGVQTTQDFVSVFLWEEDTWRFWFSELKE